jgi:hypothetical protein
MDFFVPFSLIALLSAGELILVYRGLELRTPGLIRWLNIGILVSLFLLMAVVTLKIFAYKVKPDPTPSKTLRQSSYECNIINLYSCTVTP